MAPLHAFEDQIVAGLEAEVQMRHMQLIVDLDPIVVESGGSSEEKRKRAKSGTRASSSAPGGQARQARQIAAIGGNIDAGQRPRGSRWRPAHLVDNRAQGQ